MLKATCLVLVALAVGELRVEPVQAQSAARPGGAGAQPVAIVQDYRDGVSGVRRANPDVRISVGRDTALPDEPLLVVDYPEPTSDPAGRDVQCDAQARDWTGGRAIAFQVKPAHALRLSVSFFDRNGVVYTSWSDLKEGWQSVRIAFDDIRPNHYFQPPGARLGAAIDVSDVKFIAFAPQDRTSGRLVISRFVVVK